MRARLLALAVVALIASGCALPSDSTPQRVAEGVPAELLEPAPPPTTTTTILVPTRAFELFFFSDDALVRVVRQLPTDATPADVLSSLVTGTTQEGTRNLIPPDVVVEDTRLDTSTRILTIVLADDALFAVEGTDLTRAVAQLVFTATQLPGIGRVRFEIDGNIRSVPTGPDPETSEPVERCDYQRFDPTLVCVPPTTVPPPDPPPLQSP